MNIRKESLCFSVTVMNLSLMVFFLVVYFVDQVIHIPKQDSLHSSSIPVLTRNTKDTKFYVCCWFIHSIDSVASNFVWKIWFVKYVDQDLNEHYNIHHITAHHDWLSTIPDLRKIIEQWFFLKWTHQFVHNHDIL